MQDTFGSRLKQYRKECELTQQQLADQLNIHERTVSRWERDVSLPDIGMFGLISDVLHVSLEELWGLPSDKQIKKGKFDPVALGHELAAQRTRLGESQGDLAQAVGVSSDTVSKWERGLISPNIETFIVLAKHFDLTPSALYYAQAKEFVDDRVSAQDNVKTAKQKFRNKAVKHSFKKKMLFVAGLCAICLIVAVALMLSFLLKPTDLPTEPGDQATECQHQYVSGVTPPTCSTRGYKTFTCTKCGSHYETEYTEKTEHKFAWKIFPEPTCVATGSEYLECTSCGAKTQIKILETIPHNYEQFKVTPPTCTEKGYTTYTCTVCEDSYEADYTESIPHNYEQYEKAQSTCTIAGYTSYACTVCGEKRQIYDTELAPHDYGQKITPPTCTAQGFTTFTCRVCGDHYTAEYSAKTEHVFVWKVTREPTCTVTGSRHRECSVCGAKTQSEELETIPHNYEQQITPPTCTEKGYTTYTCTICANSYQTDYTELAPHTESVWEIVREATCTSSGIQQIVCVVCNQTLETATIDKLPHNYEQQSIHSNGSEPGYFLYTCQGCGDSYKDFKNYYDGIEYDYHFDTNTCTVKSTEEFRGDRIEIPSMINGCTVTEIGWSAFEDCVSLREVIIPNTVTKIDNYAFRRCVLLEKVVIPDSVTFIGDRAFEGCQALKEATLPKNITRIRYGTFSDCINLREIEIPQSVTILEDNVFYNCQKLQNIVFPDKLFSIGGNAFLGCASLEKIEIPKTVVRIGEFAFGGCYAVKEVLFLKKTKWTADELVFNEAELADPQKAVEYLIVLYCHKIWICE